ncbi:DUF3828 domain-containing protein [Chitinophaga sp. G-6-1-13]|uniref:DUF3828 domain-containing protein n=1 Tax=Chitinophaga fulva TaxID=2728842 RepID=A0A848GU56_9BACT|nr:DUF3828 domain-containing protein [Chitinophaga fulva]NML40682.1 DUF3828 domain-containing protein [Chitinophaga fulva]
MKLNLMTVRSVFMLAAACTLFGLRANAQAPVANDSAVTMLKQFYTVYITEGAKMTEDFKKLDLLKKKYCTTKLLYKIKHTELDADPFLNAQDVDGSWVKTLSVNKDPRKEKGYIVSFRGVESNTKITVRLQVTKEKENYKIDIIEGL